MKISGRQRVPKSSCPCHCSKDDINNHKNHNLRGQCKLDEAKQTCKEQLESPLLYYNNNKLCDDNFNNTDIFCQGTNCTDDRLTVSDTSQINCYKTPEFDIDINIEIVFKVLYNAVRLLLCPVCKTDSVHLEPFFTDLSDSQDCGYIITMKCITCEAPVSILNCIIKKQDNIPPSPLPLSEHAVDIKMEPEDYIECDDVQVNEHQFKEDNLSYEQVTNPAESGSIPTDPIMQLQIDSVSSCSMEYTNMTIKSEYPDDSFVRPRIVSDLEIRKDTVDNKEDIMTPIQSTTVSPKYFCDYDPRDDTADKSYILPEVEVFGAKNNPSSMLCSSGHQLTDNIEQITDSTVYPNSAINTSISITLARRKRYICPYCPYKSFHKRNLLYHQKNCKKKLTYSCIHCDYKYLYKEDLEQHIIVKHKDTNNFTCPYCAEMSSTQTAMDSHIIKQHSTVTCYSCQHCDYVGLHVKELKSHIISTHNTKDKFHCTNCRMCFNGKSGLAMHFKRCHSHVKNGTKSQRSKVNTQFPCPHCDYVFTKSANLKRHLKNLKIGQPHLPNSSKKNCKTKSKNNSEKKVVYSCKFCYFNTSLKISLNHHLKNNHNKKKLRVFKCCSCEYTSGSRIALNKHMNVSHNIGNLRSCSICEFTTLYGSSFRKHMDTMHPTAVRYKCPFCPRTDYDYDLYTRHLKEFHTVET